jgi:hypothetical protein
MHIILLFAAYIHIIYVTSYGMIWDSYYDFSMYLNYCVYGSGAMYMYCTVSLLYVKFIYRFKYAVTQSTIFVENKLDIVIIIIQY